MEYTKKAKKIRSKTKSPYEVHPFKTISVTDLNWYLEAIDTLEKENNRLQQIIHEKDMPLPSTTANKIPVLIKSNISGRLAEGHVDPRKLLDLVDEADLIDEVTTCSCQATGETYVIECNCDEEWMDCEVYIGDEILNRSEIEIR